MCAEPHPLIVVVEDEVELSKLIAQHLEDANMQTQVYNRCAPALRFLQHNFANLLLLDLNLPDQSGFSLLDDLKKQDINVPTIFLTGNTVEADKVKGLEMGGDDYITKPFGFPELIARIHAVLRRAETKADYHITRNTRTIDEPFEICGAKVHPERLEIEFPNGVFHPIGRKELGILSYLQTHHNVVITRKEIIHSVWGLHADVRSRSLDQYIVKVRAAFEKNGLPFAAFKTVHGVGYIFEPNKPADRT
ncbi:MAG: response regulator transcription factor [Opitutaceae bacterium]|nr:response regulator transcription factor [Opitutaceae bacterium]